MIHSFRFEATANTHQQIEGWVMDQPLCGACGLSLPLLSSKIDHRRDVRLTRSALKASARSVRVLDLDNAADAILFRLTFLGVTDIRLL